jgi:hypothetical protein
MEHLIAAAIEEISGGNDGDFDYYRGATTGEDADANVDGCDRPSSSSLHFDDDVVRDIAANGDDPSNTPSTPPSFAGGAAVVASTSPTNDVAIEGRGVDDENEDDENENDDENDAIASLSPWQSTFRQVRDFHDLGHARYPPRLASWLESQRRRYGPYRHRVHDGGGGGRERL